MRILVCSDSHGDTRSLTQAIRSGAYDCILHLGDHVSDMVSVMHDFPAIPWYAVSGNCDRSDQPWERTLQWGGKTVLMLHGHTRGAKSGTALLVDAAQADGADAVLFGHTHRPYLEQRSKLLLMNPGSISADKSSALFPASFGVLEIADGIIRGNIVSLSETKM